MLPDQRLGIQARPLQRRYSRGIADIAQGHTDVAQETPPLQPVDGRAAEKASKLRLIPRQKLRQGRQFTAPELARGRLPGEPVPRAHFQAIVAAEDPVPDERAQFNGDRTFQFDGQVADAQPRIQPVRGDNRPCRAGIETTVAGAAVFALGRVGRQIEVGENFAEKDPVAELAADQVGVFADEADPRPLRQVAFENRPGINGRESPAALPDNEKSK